MDVDMKRYKLAVFEEDGKPLGHAVPGEDFVHEADKSCVCGPLWHEGGESEDLPPFGWWQHYPLDPDFYGENLVRESAAIVDGKPVKGTRIQYVGGPIDGTERFEYTLVDPAVVTSYGKRWRYRKDEMHSTPSLTFYRFDGEVTDEG